MSIEVHDDDTEQDAETPAEVLEEILADGTPDRARPTLAGDLPTVLQAGPMFRRAVAGYDRFQVDTYVQWAEDELVAADRQREHLLAAQLRTQADLDEARTLLAHSPAGGDFLQVSRRIGGLLATAADEAESIRAEADNHRAAACAQAESVLAEARRILAEAESEAARLGTEAASQLTAGAAEADRIIAAAEQARRDARDEAAHRLREVAAAEQRSAVRAEQVRVQAAEEAAAARLAARSEIIRMLETARERRRRADAEAAVVREELARDADRHRSAVLAELAELEHRRDVVRAELEAGSAPGAPSSGTPHLSARAYLDRLHDRLGRHASARGAAPAPGRTARDGERTAA